MKKKTRKRLGARAKAGIVLAVMLALTIVLGVLGVNGATLTRDGLWKLLPWIPNTDAANWPESISLGLDLRGGVYVEYQAERPEEITNSNEFTALLETTMGIMLNRLTERGYPEATASLLGDDGIRVEIPDVSDPNAILDLIGSPAELTFLDPDGNVFMTGKHVQRAYAATDTESGGYAIFFQLTDEGKELFADMTSRNIGKTIPIQLDGVQLMAPTIQTAITDGAGRITGDYTAEEAQNYAIQIQSGALPLNLTQQKVDTISATLGIDALSTSVRAALIGILLVMLIMLVRYRLSGVVASWALAIYIIALFFLLAIIPGVQLTLPGIAGVVLGIGMAVDANVIIFERFGEELRAGRPLKQAARAGFKNAWSAVLDANVTTIIAAIVLMMFGTGSIQGFAKTLFWSVVTSLFSAVLITRLLLTNVITLVGGSGKLYTRKLNAKEGQ